MFCRFNRITIVAACCCGAGCGCRTRACCVCRAEPDISNTGRNLRVMLPCPRVTVPPPQQCPPPCGASAVSPGVARATPRCSRSSSSSVLPASPELGSQRLAALEASLSPAAVPAAWAESDCPRTRRASPAPPRPLYCPRPAWYQTGTCSGRARRRPRPHWPPWSESCPPRRKRTATRGSWTGTSPGCPPACRGSPDSPGAPGQPTSPTVDAQCSRWIQPARQQDDKIVSCALTFFKNNLKLHIRTTG